MATIYMNYDYLVQTEVVTAAQFAENTPTAEAIMPELMNALFRLTYFVEHQKPAPEDGVHFFAFERCLRFPYTVRSVWILARAGHYPEAAILVRHLLETFVQLRYFVKHPQQLVGHLTATTRKEGQVGFYTMFEEFSPGYYQNYYRALCSVAHAGIGLSALQSMQQAKDENGKLLTPIGCEFNADVCSYVVNQTLMLLAGFVRFFPEWFPSYKKLADEETEGERSLALAALDEWRQGHRAKFASAKEWHTRSDALMGPAS